MARLLDLDRASSRNSHGIGERGAHWGGGVWMGSRDLARFGLRYLNGGAWNGRRLLSPSGLRAPVSHASTTPMYGYLWWLQHDAQGQQVSFAAQGGGARQVIVIPDYDMVIAFKWLQDEVWMEFLERTLGDGAGGGFVDADRAVAGGDAVMAQEGGALVFPGAGHTKDRDGAGRFASRFETAADDAAGDKIGARVVDHVHDDGDTLDAWLAEQQAGERRDLAHAGVAADLAVVGGTATAGVDGVEGGEAGAAAADEQRKRALELDDAPRDPAVVGAVDAHGLQLEGTRLAVAAGGGIDVEVTEHGPLAKERVVVALDAGIESDPAAIGGAREGVDLGQEQVAAREEPPEAGEDGSERFLQPEVLRGGEGGEGNAHGVARGGLDVDAPRERGEGGGAACAVVVGDAEEALAVGA